MGNLIKVEVLLNSRATSSFIDIQWARQRPLKHTPLLKTIPVFNVDGMRNKDGDITHSATLLVRIGKNAERL
ncbi:hypothetical protein J3A83DRAFT_4086598 [Scleroderma citrinum]